MSTWVILEKTNIGVLRTLARTKIFISSVNEDGLKPLRKSVYQELQALGHEPVMWEENIGPWLASADPVTLCLQAVEQCDIYLLFIGSKAGTYDKAAERTITHLEFIKAQEQEITILVFADVEVKRIFFGTVKPLLDQYIDHFISEEERFPSPLHMMDALRAQSQIPAHIDPYVWYFLYDMILRSVYVDDLSLGVPIDWKAYFSDLLRRGSLLLPLEESIQLSGNRLEQLDEAFDLIVGLMPQMQINSFHNAEKFLSLIMDQACGGMIEHGYGKYMTESVGSYGDCSAITLYVCQEDQLHLVAKCGKAQGPPYYLLENKSSYAVLTYHMGDQHEQVFFTAAKNMFYYCIRSGPYVITLHYPAEPDWDYRRFIRYKESVNHAIISKNPVIIEFIKLCLGGMQHG